MVLGSQRRATAELIAHLAEMDARKLYLSQAASSLFVYCVQRLRFGEDEACRRIDAARLAHRFPVIYGMLELGEVSLSVLGRLKSFINADNADELLALVRGKSVRDAERLLAARFPKPSVPDRIRKLPNARTPTSTNNRAPRDVKLDVHLVGSEVPDANQTGETLEVPLFEQRVQGAKHSDSATPAGDGSGLRGDSATVPQATRPIDAGTAESKHSRVSNPSSAGERLVRPSKIDPLASDRFEVRLTMSRAQEQKLRLALDLTSHENPKRELATVIETALDLLIAERMKRKFGKTTRPQKKKRSAKRTHVRNATRREVVERDGLQCSFVDSNGRRCTETRFLELDHVDARALGGGSEKEKVRVLCRAHNQGEAERVFGREYVERKRNARRKLDGFDVRERLGARYVAELRVESLDGHCGRCDARRQMRRTPNTAQERGCGARAKEHFDRARRARARARTGQRRLRSS